MLSKPDHQQFVIGEYVIYSHDYDGDVLQIVKGNEQEAINEKRLLDLLDKIFEERRLLKS